MAGGPEAVSGAAVGRGRLPGRACHQQWQLGAASHRRPRFRAQGPSPSRQPDASGPPSTWTHTTLAAASPRQRGAGGREGTAQGPRDDRHRQLRLTSEEGARPVGVEEAAPCV